MLNWSAHLPDESLWYRLAEPDDADLDVFTSGGTSEAIEVNDYFTSRQWYDYGKGVAKPPVFQFGTPGEVVGYLAISFANKPHPSERSPSKARYLVVYVVGIHERFQGTVNPHSHKGERFSDTVIRAVEQTFAREKTGCVGVYLRVRQSNARAVAFYRRLGFLEDPGGPMVVNEEAPQFVMRKLFDKPT